MYELLDAVLEKEVENLRVGIMNEEFGEVGFTSDDRKLLITLGVEFKHLADGLLKNEKRFEAIEERFKANDDRVAKIEKEVWTKVAWATGMGATAGLVLGIGMAIVVHLIK